MKSSYLQGKSKPKDTSCKCIISSLTILKGSFLFGNKDLHKNYQQLPIIFLFAIAYKAIVQPSNRGETWEHDAIMAPLAYLSSAWPAELAVHLSPAQTHGNLSAARRKPCPNTGLSSSCKHPTALPTPYFHP